MFAESTDAATIGAAVSRHRATRLNCVPAVWRRLLDAPDIDLSSLRFADTGTSATPPELLAVVGLPDATWGEVVCAVVVGSVTLDELHAHCEGALASFKHLRRLEVVTEIPRTAPTGQVQRRLLVDQFSRR